MTDDEDIERGAGEGEGSEAEGVERLEATATLPPEQGHELDRATLDELDEDQRAELEGDAATRGPGGGVAVGPHFLLREFHCKDGTPVPAAAVPGVKRLVAQVLEPMRAKFGRCTVVSGYRTANHNASVGGKPDSRHMYHNHPAEPAADLQFASGNPSQWTAEAERLMPNRGGIGTYPTFTHVDIRPNRARWDQNTA